MKLYYHPLSSFCWKVLIALYEMELDFERHVVDLGDAGERAAFAKVWPLAKFPVLEIDGEAIPESTMIIERLAMQHGGALVPAAPEAAWRVRTADRFYDLYAQVPMQKIVTDNLRPEGGRDRLGVAQARAQLDIALALVDQNMAGKIWAVGEVFSMADCAAAPALYYADRVAPFASRLPHAYAYLERLKQRPSFARVLNEAEPYLAMFPG